MIALDTNVLSELMSDAPNSRVAAWFKQQHLLLNGADYSNAMEVMGTSSTQNMGLVMRSALTNSSAPASMA